MSWVSNGFLSYFVLLVLLPVIYAIFGWYTSEHITPWSHGVVDIIERMELSPNHALIEDIGYGLAIAVILGMNLSLTLMTREMTWIFSSWFKSDLRAFLSVLGWSFAVVLIFRWIGYFTRLLLLLCVTILGCLELQEKGYNKWGLFLILTILSLGGFGAGVWLFSLLNKSPEVPHESYWPFNLLS